MQELARDPLPASPIMRPMNRRFSIQHQSSPDGQVSNPGDKKEMNAFPRKTATVPDAIQDPWYRKTGESQIRKAIRPEWHISDRVCGLCDHERHLAHIVKVGRQWFLFDATRSSEAGDGFLFLGSFAGRQAAMDAAEQNYALAATLPNSRIIGVPGLDQPLII